MALIPGHESLVSEALRRQEMIGERWANHVRAVFLLLCVAVFAAAFDAQSPAANRVFGCCIGALGLLSGALHLALRDPSRYYGWLKYVTVFADITIAYATTVGSLLNHSGVYEVYRAPAPWVIIATFNALSGLRYAPGASLFGAGLTVLYGAVELVLVTSIHHAWSPASTFVGEGLNMGDCVQSFVFAAVPGVLAAVVARQSRRLVAQQATEAVNRTAAEERHLSAMRELEMACELAESRQRFLSIASHELRTPVAALSLSVQTLEMAPAILADAEARTRVLARVSRQTRRITHLITQLLDTTRLGHYALALDRSECELTALCREALDGLAPEQLRRVQFEDSGPVSGSWDRIRLEEVIVNLVTNSLRYSEERTSVTVRVSGSPERAAIIVSDHGFGIAADEIKLLFQPFSRTRSAQSKRGTGLGLGLYIAQEIVKSHGGRIVVESLPGVGSTFTVEFPLRAASHGENGTAQGPA